MSAEPTFRIGDLVIARDTICNDGGIPNIDPDALLAIPGSRGVLVKTGHVEAVPDQEIYLVRFEDADGVLGPPVGCLPEELNRGQSEP